MGWVARVQALLTDEPECPAHAWLALLAVAQAMFVSYDLEEDSIWGLGIGCSGAVGSVGGRSGRQRAIAVAVRVREQRARPDEREPGQQAEQPELQGRRATAGHRWCSGSRAGAPKGRARANGSFTRAYEC